MLVHTVCQRITFIKMKAYKVSTYRSSPLFIMIYSSWLITHVNVRDAEWASRCSWNLTIIWNAGEDIFKGVFFHWQFFDGLTKTFRCIFQCFRAIGYWFDLLNLWLILVEIEFLQFWRLMHLFSEGLELQNTLNLGFPHCVQFFNSLIQIGTLILV